MISKKFKVSIIAISCLCILLGVFIGYSATPSTQMHLTGGPYPGAPNYTVWKEGSYYYAKDSNGYVEFNSNNPTTLIQSVENVLNATGGIIYLIDVRLPVDVVQSSNVIIVENYLGSITTFSPNMNIQNNLALVKVDIEGIWREHGLSNFTEFFEGYDGMCYDPSTYDFYVTFCSRNATDDCSVVIKLNSDGEVMAHNFFADRSYSMLAIADGGKLIAIELSVKRAGLIDQLNKTDLTTLANIDAYPDADSHSYILVKVSDTVLVTMGSIAGSTTQGYYWKINLVTPAVTRVNLATTGAPQAALKVDDTIYADQYGQSTGNFKLNTTTWGLSAMGSPPSTTFDLDPLFEYNGRILHAGGGAGSNPPVGNQPMYWYNITDEAWTAISEYASNDQKPSKWGGMYFPLLRKAIIGSGSTRYFNSPASQWIFNAENSKWMEITHMFDGVYAQPTVLDVTFHLNATVTPKRLSSTNGMYGIGMIGDLENFGAKPCGFILDGYYRFLMHFEYKYFDTAERSSDVLIFCTLKS